jgi:hypothetical protein
MYQDILLKCPVSGYLSLHTGPVGEPRMESFAGKFWREEDIISGFPFLDTEKITILCLGGQLEILEEGQGSAELISDYVAQRACL